MKKILDNVFNNSGLCLMTQANPNQSKLVSNFPSLTYSKPYFNQIENPFEYNQAQDYLKQMEIESMNFMESNNDIEGDQVRARIQKHKQEFNEIRREMRKI